MKKTRLAALVVGLSLVASGCVIKQPADQGKQSRHQHNSHHEAAGIDKAYYGDYEARFEGSTEHAARIHIEDSGVYVNNREVHAVDDGKKLAFRVGKAQFMLMKKSRWGNWHDDDAGNKGTIVPVRG